MIDEQLAHLVDDADDLALRALVSETPAASFESNDARKHVDAMRRHRDHVVAEIAELEAAPGRAARPPHGMTTGSRRRAAVRDPPPRPLDFDLAAAGAPRPRSRRDTE